MIPARPEEVGRQNLTNGWVDLATDPIHCSNSLDMSSVLVIFLSFLSSSFLFLSIYDIMNRTWSTAYEYFVT